MTSSNHVSLMQKISFWLQYAPLAVIFYLFRQLPLTISGGLWKSLALLLYYCVPPLSKTARKNIRMTIGRDWDDRQIEDVIKKTFIHSGYFIAEWINTPNLTDSFNDSVTIEGEEHLQAALMENKGVVTVTGHFGHWEVFGHATRTRGYKFNVIYKKMKNFYVDQLFFRLRTNYSEDLIEVKEWKDKSPAVFAKNQIIGIIPDQDARHHGIFVDFLGKPASTYVGPAMFSLENNAPMILCFFWREKLGQYHLSFEPTVRPDPAADRESQIRFLTEQWVQKLEHYVRAYPDHYFWFHRRWKTQPPA